MIVAVTQVQGLLRLLHPRARLKSTLKSCGSAGTMHSSEGTYSRASDLYKRVMYLYIVSATQPLGGMPLSE